MQVQPQKSTPEGRIPQLLTILKRLVSEDPLLALVAVVIMFPVGGAIATSAITTQLENLPILLGVEIVVILFLCVPLIITKTWKQNQRDIAKQKETAITTEAHRRIKSEERKLITEEHKQERFNILIDAKIRTLKAQEDFILSQSDRHERHVLKETAAELSESINKSFTFVDEEKCGKNVSEILQELAKIQIDYDKVLGAIDRIESAVGTKTDIEGPPEINISDTVELDETDYKTLYEQKQADIENLIKDLEGGASNYNDLETRYDKILAQNEKLAGELSSAIQLNQGLRSEIKSLGAPEISPEQEAIRKIEDLSIETHGAKTELQAKAVEEIAEAKEELIEAVEAIEALEDSEAEEEAPKNYWNCSNCGRANNLKQVRCPKCGTPKKD